MIDQVIWARAIVPFLVYDWSYILIQVSQVSPTRPEGAEAHSPGQRPGLLRALACRPVRAKALKLQAIYKAFALTGRLADCHYTQGDALGWELLPFQGVLLESFRLFSPYYRSFWIFLACQPYRSKNFSHFFSVSK